MIAFNLKTRISKFDTFKEFAEEFKLNANDLVITQSFMYEPFMKDLNLPCSFIMQEKYGNGEPSDEMINNILADIRDIKFDRIIAVGGGTVIDISKIFVLKGLQNATDAFERKMPIEKEKQLVIIPTTCGTGSEVTNISIAEIKAKHTKMGLADQAIVADDAVLVPEMLKGLPFKFYAFSAIDALIHAMESYLSPKASSYTRAYSKIAIEMILKVFNGIVANGPDYRFDHFAEMLEASNIAGIAFGNAGVGAVHALSYPLGGNYHVPHGEANYQFLTGVFKVYFQKDPNGSIKELNAILAENLNISADEIAANPSVIYERLEDLLNNLATKNQLRNFGMKEEEIELFADSVIATQQRLLGNNYVFLERDEIRDIYKSLY